MYYSRRVFIGVNGVLPGSAIPPEDLWKEADVLPAARIIIFYAHDGYSTSLPLTHIIDNDILMAHKMNGITLPVERGFPFQLVAEDKWGYKWIKWTTGFTTY